MEFESDDDVDKQVKNSSDVKTERKVRVRKKILHYYEISSDEEEGKHRSGNVDSHLDKPKSLERHQWGKEITGK